MAFAALLAFSIFAAEPAAAPSPPAKGPHAVAAAVADVSVDSDDDEGDIPPGAPTDDYGFVAWCYGALSEYLVIYDVVQPDLKDIDKMFGSSVQEDQPYMSDVAAERVALKRFGAALDAAEHASDQPIAAQGAADIQSGRGIWAAAKLQTHRKLADAWLFWGIPRRCEAKAKALKTHSAPPGPAPGPAAPSAIDIAMAQPAPTLDPMIGRVASTPTAPVRTGPAPPAPRAGAVLIGN